MWAILKFDKKNLEILKKDFYKKLGNDVKFYNPKLELKKTKKKKTFVKEISLLKDIESLEQLIVKYIGKKGLFTNLLKSLSNLDQKDKASAGKTLNILKKEIDECFNEKKKFLSDIELNKKLEHEKIDISLPTRPEKKGGIHPISKTMDDIICIMGSHGFKVEEGRHIENEFYNFTALNIPEEHPARQEHDTFYINKYKNLLRTPTSPVQIRVMKNIKPPIKTSKSILTL